MHEAVIVQTDDNVFQIKGVIDHETATTLLPVGNKLFGECPLTHIVVDLSVAEVVSSACLALLVAWLRRIKLKGKTIEYIGFSEQLLRIVKLSNLSQLLGVSK